MSVNVVEFPKSVTAADVLQQALDDGVKDVFIAGRFPDGDGYFAASNPDLGDILFLMERFKAVVIGGGT